MAPITCVTDVDRPPVDVTPGEPSFPIASVKRHRGGFPE
jgi:hypothetical protein